MPNWRSLFDNAGAATRPFSPVARLSVIGLMVVACVSLATIHVVAPAPRLIWNASASAPVGLYGVRMVSAIERGDLVLAWLPDTARLLAARRSYLPFNTPAVKRVAAVGGDHVCGRRTSVTINGNVVAEARRVDHAGLELKPWQGCVVLLPGQVFLLNVGAPGSFDGRYFGPSERRDVIGKLVPLWVF